MDQRDRNLYLRANIIAAIREFFRTSNFLEVETPLRIPANAPEEYIDPYCSEGHFLQTSPEICMKRLLCRGHQRLFQISKCWRRQERGSRHLPEFTMLEWYRADSDYTCLMADCEALLSHIASTCGCQDGLNFRGKLLQPAAQTQRITVEEAFCRFSGKEMREAVKDGSFDELMVNIIEPALANIDCPVILMDYPREMAALSRLKTKDSPVAERFELYLGGLELANGFSELTDPQEQSLRFTETNQRRQAYGLPQLPMPEPFLSELGLMPDSAGIALGIDRMVMLFAGAESIDEVVAFTPEEL